MRLYEIASYEISGETPEEEAEAISRLQRLRYRNTSAERRNGGGGNNSGMHRREGDREEVFVLTLESNPEMTIDASGKEIWSALNRIIMNARRKLDWSEPASLFALGELHTKNNRGWIEGFRKFISDVTGGPPDIFVNDRD